MAGSTAPPPKEQPVEGGGDMGRSTTARDLQIAGYATELYGMAVECAHRREPVEARWYRDTLQFQGLYDDETQAKLEARPNSSRVFVNQTRPKTASMRDRLEEILFPKDEPNWDVLPVAAPNMEKIAERAPEPAPEMPPGAEEGMAAEGPPPPEPDPEAVAAQELLADNSRKADNMRRVMRKQLEQADYAKIGCMVLEQMCKLGTGICKGPMAGTPLAAWHRDGASWSKEFRQDERPMFQFVDVWDFFPDMDASEIEECEYTFQLHRMNRRQIRQKVAEGEFDAKQARELLKNDPSYTPIDQNFSDHIRYLRKLDDTAGDGQQHRYPVLEYHGPVPYPKLAQIAEAHDKSQLLDLITSPEDPLETVEAIIWFSHDRILKFGLKPTFDSLYSVCRMDTSDSSLFGVGIPHMIRDPQAALNSAWRMIMENAGMTGIPMYIVNRDLIDPEPGGGWDIEPGKVWVQNADSASHNPAVLPVQIQGNAADLQTIIQMAARFCDDESRMPLVAQGDPGTTATQTAHGMSLLVNAVNIVFKAAARRFDREFTIPCIRRLYDWNMEFSDDDEIKGDLEVAARGSSVLLVREQQASNLLMILNIAGTNPLLSDMIRIPTVARKLFQALQIDKDEIVLSDKELEQLEKAKAQQGNPEVDAQMQLEQMKIQGQMQIEQMRLQVEMTKLSQQSQISIEKISADLEKARLGAVSKERLFGAEAALKERHGEGI